MTARWCDTLSGALMASAESGPTAGGGSRLCLEFDAAFQTGGDLRTSCAPRTVWEYFW